MRIACLIATLIVLQQVNAQETEERPSSFCSMAVYYDQDYTLEQLGLKSLNEDRNYTMGLGIVLTTPGLKNCFFYAPHRLLNQLFNRRFLNVNHTSGANITHSLMIGNGSFTPDSLPASYIIKNDRPYSSLTYLQTITSTVDPEKFRQYITTFSVGFIGTSISREAQIKIHKAMNENDTKDPRTPKGWNNQVSNGGELTLAYAVEEVRLLTKKQVCEEKKISFTGLELKHSWKYSLGYYTNLSYAFNFRLGKIDPRNWTYRVNVLGSSNEVTKPEESNTSLSVPTISYYEKKKTFELYTFSSLRPVFILYNALLNGQFRKSEHTIGFNDMRHMILEFDGGVATSIPFCKRTLLEFKLRLSGRSPEFKLANRPPRWHYWGGLDIVFSHY